MKKLYKSRTDVKIDGVCGGLGQFFGVDATVFRLIFLVALVFGGSGGIAYIIAMIVMPREPKGFDGTDYSN